MWPRFSGMFVWTEIIFVLKCQFKIKTFWYGCSLCFTSCVLCWSWSFCFRDRCVALFWQKQFHLLNCSGFHGLNLFLVHVLSVEVYVKHNCQTYNFLNLHICCSGTPVLSSFLSWWGLCHPQQKEHLWTPEDQSRLGDLLTCLQPIPIWWPFHVPKAAGSSSTLVPILWEILSSVSTEACPCLFEHLQVRAASSKWRTRP